MTSKKQSKSIWWWVKRIGIGIGLFLYFYPFYCLALNEWPGWNLGKLYTFGLELKDFMTAWIALGGVMAVVVGIFQTQRRITKQGEQFDTQIGKQNDQLEIQQRQLSEQQKQQRDNRFASGVELLGNKHESSRVGGAYNLYFLARDHKEEYLTPVCEILCAHIRTITSDEDYQEKHKERPSNEVQTILNLLFLKQENGVSIFKNVDIFKDLRGTFLYGADFWQFELDNVMFGSAILSHSVFASAILNTLVLLDR